MVEPSEQPKAAEYSVSMRSPINIALIKYWGKAHDTLIIPTNNSFSITLNKDDLCSSTTVSLIDEEDEEGQDGVKVVLCLNGEVCKVNERIR